MVTQLPYPYGGGTVELDTDDVAVHIAPDDGVALELGELATVVIILQEKEDVLWLPPAAIRSYQGRDFVVIEHADGQQNEQGPIARFLFGRDPGGVVAGLSIGT